MVSATIIGDDKINAKLTALPDKIIPAVAARVQAAAYQLESDVKTQKLSGQALHVRSGRLRRSIHANDVKVSDSKISTTVGTNVEYAARHEYGFKGTEDVKAHTRRITQAWGKQLREPLTINVRPFSRKVDYQEHSFLRSQLREDAQMIRDQIHLGVEEGLKL
jgi:phage gpG-like protein